MNNKVPDFHPKPTSNTRTDMWESSNPRRSSNVPRRVRGPPPIMPAQPDTETRSRLNADQQSHRVAALGRANHISSAVPNRSLFQNRGQVSNLDRH
jgi:hypothetical protein